MNDERQKLFDAETTTLTLRPASSMQNEDALAVVVIQVSGEISEAHVDQFIADIGADYWWADRVRRNTQWGAQTSGAEIIVQFIADVGLETVWLLVGAALDRLLPEREKHGALPDESRAENAARLRILTGHLGVHADTLELTGTVEDTDARKRVFRYRDPIHVFEVTVHSTPSGFPFATSISKDYRTFSAE